MNMKTISKSRVVEKLIYEALSLVSRFEEKSAGFVTEAADQPDAASGSEGAKTAPNPNTDGKKQKSDDAKAAKEAKAAADKAARAEELKKIVSDLGLDIDKSKLAAAVASGDERKAVHNKVLADFFMGMLKSSPNQMSKAVALLKKAAADLSKSEIESSFADGAPGGEITDAAKDKSEKESQKKKNQKEMIQKHHPLLLSQIITEI